MKKAIAVFTLTLAMCLPITMYAQNGAAQGAAKQAAKEKREKGGETHPDIVKAMHQLQAARITLVKYAANDFQGHKKEAIASIDQALEHLRQCLEVDTK